jgi:transcriptional regulator with XRE-family HTH domain
MESEDPRFRHVGLSNDGEIVFCELDNGKTYSMPLEALERAEAWDPKAKPKTTGILDDGYAAFVQFSTGTQIDFPSDFVLYVCEPTSEDRSESGVGRRIREIREARGMTLDELAARTGIAKPNLSRLENDKVTPSLDTLVTVAAALDTHPASIVSEKRSERVTVWTRHAFARWKTSLRWDAANGRSESVTAAELVATFLATRPEHRYAESELLTKADRPSESSKFRSHRVDAEKWAAEVERAKGSPKRRGKETVQR